MFEETVFIDFQTKISFSEKKKTSISWEFGGLWSITNHDEVSLESII